MSNLNSTVFYRRYSNRKIYNISASRYVNGGEVLDAVRRGQEVVITDHKTNKDVTSEIVLSLLAAKFTGDTTPSTKQVVFQAVSSLTSSTNT